MEKNLFAKVILYGIAGAALGILAGFLLGLSIWGLQTLAERLMSGNPEMMAGGPPGTVYTLLGMGFGALLGSFNGTAVVMKKNDKK